jgi:translation initiation factor RLI1
MKFYPELGQERAFVDAEIFMGCGSCVVTCPGKARTMKLVRTPEHVSVDVGHVFWDNTGT